MAEQSGLRVQTMEEIQYKADLFDIINSENDCLCENEVDYARFFGFVTGVCAAYEEWEKSR